jgi:hypothetical protein
MAYISQRRAFWRAEIRRSGHKPCYGTFDTKVQAQQWTRRIESEMDSGVHFDRSVAERTTLTVALNRYQRDVVPLKRYPKQENQRIAQWLRHELSYRIRLASR